MNVLLGIGFGIGLGFLAGCLFSRLSEKQMFQLVTTTSDSLVRSALFPGLPKEAFEPSDPEPAEEMFATAEDAPQEQNWLWKDDGPWDTEVEE